MVACSTDDGGGGGGGSPGLPGAGNGPRPGAGNGGTPTFPGGGTPNGSGGSFPAAGFGGTPIGQGGSLPGGGAGGTPVNPGGGAPPTGGTGTGGSAGVGTAGGSAGGAAGGSNCPMMPGVISDFESGKAEVLKQEGWSGNLWETFQDPADASKVMMSVVAEGTANCNRNVLRVAGTGVSKFAGIGFTFGGTNMAPVAYNASTKYSAIRFRAKRGPMHNAMSPVRMNISTPWTEGTSSGGTCTVAANCYNHLGRFLRGPNDLTTDWKTFTFCFDRDMYPLFMPHASTNEQRRTVGANMLKVQFQFNKDKNLGATPVMGVYPEHPPTLPFEFFVDDVQLVAGDAATLCPGPALTSVAGTKTTFPKNAALGTCAPATDAAKFNGAIAAAYNHWKATFVKPSGSFQKVVDIQVNRTPSEAIAYGMLITAAVGDRPLFDALWGYGKSQGAESGLMNWREDGSGSASDADLDMAYALLLAGDQWGGTYAAEGNTLAGRIRTADVKGGHLGGGSTFNDTSIFNPSYFTPGYYRSFNMRNAGADWTGLLATDYGIFNQCERAYGNGNGLLTDWCLVSNGAPANPHNYGIAVVNEFCQNAGNCTLLYGYDAARVPWRIGFEACVWGGTEATTYLNKLMNKFATYPDHGAMGARIDLLRAGWTNLLGGAPHGMSLLNQMAFIGPAGVGAMANPAHATMRDRAFRAVLDLIETPEFNRTYYGTTLGLITLLQMSGNFPTLR